MTKPAMIIGTSVVAVLSLLMIYSVGEVSLRFYHWFEAGIPFFEQTGKSMSNLSPITLDDVLGWRATEQYRQEATEKTGHGSEYRIQRTQNEIGFRMFGNVRSRKPKVFVIGDSFTQAIQVSDNKTYYAIIRDALDVEVFAYGAGGYGTLQEYMILDRFFDLIEPDLIIWQYCSNDFINNDSELEKASRLNNNGLRRPYWVDGRIDYIFPKYSFEKAREFAQAYSRLLYLILSRLDRLRAIDTVATVESEIEKQGLNHKGFLRSIQITDDLMRRVRSRVGSLPIVAFGCDTGQPYTDALKEISSHHQITLFEDVAWAVREAGERGEDVRASDLAHWNEYGHRVAGLAIANHLREKNIIRHAASSPSIHNASTYTN